MSSIRNGISKFSPGSYATRIGLVLVLGLVTHGISAQDNAEEITIRFAPPDGTRFVRTSTFEKVLVTGDSEESISSAQRIQHNFEFRRTESGWTLSMSPVMDSQMNALARSQPGLAALLIQNDFVMNYDLQGKLLGISGLDRALNLAVKSMPPEIKPLINEAMTNYRQGFEQIWSGRFRFTELSQRAPVRIGLEWGGQTQIPYGSLGMIDAYVGGQITEWVVINGKRCLLIQVALQTEDPALSKISQMLVSAIEQIVALAPIPAAAMSGMVSKFKEETSKLRISQLLEVNARAIDPDTHLTCKEANMRTMKFTWIENGEVSDAGEVRETEVSEFAYQ